MSRQEFFVFLNTCFFKWEFHTKNSIYRYAIIYVYYSYQKYLFLWFPIQVSLLHISRHKYKTNLLRYFFLQELYYSRCYHRFMTDIMIEFFHLTIIYIFIAYDIYHFQISLRNLYQI